MKHLSNLNPPYIYRESPTVISLNMSVTLFICEFRETGKAVAVKNKPVWLSMGNIAWQLQ
jgi:hypothetical protein